MREGEGEREKDGAGENRRLASFCFFLSIHSAYSGVQRATQQKKRRKGNTNPLRREDIKENNITRAQWDPLSPLLALAVVSESFHPGGKTLPFFVGMNSGC